MDLACNWKLTQHQLQVLSGRGGTSGIGVNAFFKGGFLVDGEHISQRDDPFLPSRLRLGFEPPPTINRTRIPENWSFRLLLAPGRRLHGRGELEFFAQNTPIPAAEVFKTIALVYHGLIPAVASGDLHLLRETLQSIHKVGFKRRELTAQSVTVQLAISTQ